MSGSVSVGYRTMRVFAPRVGVSGVFKALKNPIPVIKFKKCNNAPNISRDARKSNTPKSIPQYFYWPHPGTLPLIDHTARLGDIGIIVDTVSNVVVPPSLKQLSFPPETSMTNDVTSCYPIGLCALWSLLFQSRLSLKRSQRGR